MLKINCLREHKKKIQFKNNCKSTTQIKAKEEEIMETWIQIKFIFLIFIIYNWILFRINIVMHNFKLSAQYCFISPSSPSSSSSSFCFFFCLCYYFAANSANKNRTKTMKKQMTNKKNYDIILRNGKNNNLFTKG